MEIGKFSSVILKNLYKKRIFLFFCLLKILNFLYSDHPDILTS